MSSRMISFQVSGAVMGEMLVTVLIGARMALVGGTPPSPAPYLSKCQVSKCQVRVRLRDLSGIGPIIRYHFHGYSEFVLQDVDAFVGWTLATMAAGLSMCVVLWGALLRLPTVVNVAVPTALDVGGGGGEQGEGERAELLAAGGGDEDE